MRARIAGHGRIVAGAVGVLVLVAVAIVLTGGGNGRVASPIKAAVAPARAGEEVDLDPEAIARERGKAENAGTAAGSSRPQLVVAVPPGGASEEAPAPSKGGSGTREQSDAQIERDLVEFRKYLATIPPTTGKRAEVISSGEAAAPFDAPSIVIEVVQAANQIALTPYRWGGGHGPWRDKGYDCSGSISFALAAAGLLNAPLTSGSFMSYGAPGRGKWITIYANAGHMFMTVAGLRFDTGGLRTGTRWQAAMRPTSGFTVRHPPGL